MKWEDRSKKSETIFIALGQKGCFLVWKSGRYFYAKYISKEKKFQFPRQKTAKAMKQLCEENDYWEAEHVKQRTN